jgi:NADH-quinone oxidoreductase subunit I
MEEPGENIMNKDKLMAIGDKYEAMIAADKAADAEYR